MIIAGKYEVPDKCPKKCIFKNDLYKYGQNAICMRCPVLICAEDEFGPLIHANEFRPDWAAEWERFFKYGVIPELRLK